MKKTMAAILAGMVIATAPAAAEPVKFSGDAAIKYQRDTAAGELTVSGSVYTLKLLGEAGLGGGWSLYARLGAQSVTNPSLTDFNTGAGVYGEN